MLKKVTLGVAAALMSTSAMALTPTDPVDIEIYMSGASAQDIGIAGLFNTICQPGTLDTYSGSGHSAYFCQVNPADVVGGLPDFSAANPGANANVLFHKRSAGGSAQGVNPVIDENPIDAMSITNGNCTLTATPNTWSCTTTNPGDLVSVVSDAGVSDVNPEMFVGVNTPTGENPVDPAVVAAKMQVRPAAALVFGIPVTLTLRDALQEAQGLTVGLEDEANMPSLSKAQVASLMAGKIQNWDAFLVNGTPLTAAVTNPPAANARQVHICRRVNGSGTQAQMNAKFLNYPCSAGALVPTSSGNPIVGPVVALNSGSSDVDRCLDDFNNGTNIQGVNPFLRQAWAIGLQSTEKNATLSRNYRFVKIDNIAPTLDNAASGKYMDVAEQTFQWRSIGASADPANDISVDQQNILETIAAGAASPDTLAGPNLNQKFAHTWGQAGYLALTSNGHSIDADPATAGIQIDLINHPVTPYSHKTATGSLNNCISPVIGNLNGNSSL